MALKALLLANDVKRKKKALEEARAKLPGLADRERELTAAIDEVETDEQRSQVEALVAEFEQTRDQVTADIAQLEADLAQLEADLEEEEAQQETDPPAEDSGESEEERSKKTMNIPERAHAQARALVYGDMTRAEQQEMIQRADVKAFMENIRITMRARGQTRAINNIGLTIPDVFLGLLRQNVLLYSKLTGRVTVQNVKGEGRVLITGDIPEAVWTECCANLNELSMTFYRDMFGCFKLGGYFVVCNANLEDSDLDLAAEILTTLAQSLGYTDDKTILYGTGTNMPLGIVPSLAQQSQPADYPATARPWVDLHSTNVITIANTYTGLALFQQLALAAGYAKNKYARGEKTWVMNEFTYNYLLVQAMNIDASGAITSGVNGTMPVIGGAIVILPDSIVPDYNIVMGYFDLYRKVDRSGEKYDSSDEYFFLSDQTVFKATVRWDGKPLIREAFVLIGINGTSPTTAATFVGDGANQPTAILVPATAGVTVGSSINIPVTVLPYGVDTVLSWESATAAKATVNSSTGEVTGVSSGSSVITVTAANGLTAQTTVTVSPAG